MHRIHLEHRVIWLQKSCVAKITQHPQIILPLELWHMNACMEEDHMWVNLEKKSEITFCQNKFKLKKEKFQEAGQLKQPILLIR